MKHEDCTAFLQWALPRLGFRWAGFRKVRRQVCRRIRRRIATLELEGFDDYRRYLETHDRERRSLDGLCRITISRFYRDRGVFERLTQEALPLLAERALRRRAPLRAWSAGCASGEEPYTLAIAWRLGVAARFPEVDLEIVATDADPHMLERARRGVYPAGTLREHPTAWRAQAFQSSGETFRLKEDFKRGIEWLSQDLRAEMPAGPFDLVLCRNLAFTYFDPPLQERVLEAVGARLRAGGLLVIGGHESLPVTGGFENAGRCLYRHGSVNPARSAS